MRNELLAKLTKLEIETIKIYHRSLSSSTGILVGLSQDEYNDKLKVMSEKKNFSDKNLPSIERISRKKSSGEIKIDSKIIGFDKKLSESFTGKVDLLKLNGKLFEVLKVNCIF